MCVPVMILVSVSLAFVSIEQNYSLQDINIHQALHKLTPKVPIISLVKDAHVNKQDICFQQRHKLYELMNLLSLFQMLFRLDHVQCCGIVFATSLLAATTTCTYCFAALWLLR